MQHTKDEWNVYGKVKKITKDSNSLEIRYLYDASGNRVMKALNTGAATYPETADYYIRDASGNIMTTYRRKNSQVSSVWNTEIRAYEQALYGSDRLGVYIPWTLTYTGKLDDLGGYTYPTANEIKHERTLNYRWMNNKRYELKDHLGNVHATLGDYRLSTVSGSGPYTYGSFSADQKSMYNYFSFGMPKYGQDQWYEANDQTASMGTTAYTYRFGFNGQEKVNEIAGVGNHNTAEFWEYDTRLGRRWNLDPVIKPHRSPYDAFDNSPIWKIDPDGADDYYNKAGKFIGSDGIGSAIRLMDNDNIQDVKSFALSLAFAKMVKLDIEKARNMPGMSREIVFKNEGARFKDMMRDAQTDNRERGGYLYLDTKGAEVGLSNIFTGESSAEISLMNKTGGSFGNGEMVILGTIHTHQLEQEFFNQGYSDEDLFESQYRPDRPDADGNMAESSVDNRYTIGIKNVNFYSPDGKGKSSNNAGSREDLESGKFNIGKEVLQKYGTMPKQNYIPLLLLIGLLSSLIASGCKQESKSISITTTEDAKGKIIYRFNPEVTRYILDSIMNPKFCMDVVACAVDFDINSNVTSISFTYDNGNALQNQMYVWENTSRYLAIENKLIPIVFREDFRYGDLPKTYIDSIQESGGTVIRDSYDFAVLTIDDNQEIIKCLNYLLCDGKSVAKPYYGPAYR